MTGRQCWAPGPSLMSAKCRLRARSRAGRAGGPGQAGGHCGERPGPVRVEVVGQLRGSGWELLHGWEGGKQESTSGGGGTRQHTGARQQCLQEGWGSVRAVTTGEGHPGGGGETPTPPPELQGGFLCSPPGRRHAGLPCLYLQVF